LPLILGQISTKTDVKVLWTIILNFKYFKVIKGHAMLQN
jgi:hypothetical protein